MKKLVLAALAVMFAGQVYALPHDNRSDVKSTVKEFIPYTDFHIINDVGLGVGTTTVTEENSLGMAAIVMSNTNADIHTLIPLPDNICVDCPIKFSVLWSTSESTTTRTATWKILYSAKALGEGLAAAATALDTAITADAEDDTAYGLNETEQGVISSSTLSSNDILHILVELDAVSGAAPSAIYFHGLYLEYTRNQL